MTKDIAKELKTKLELALFLLSVGRIEEAQQQIDYMFVRLELLIGDEEEAA